MSEADTAFVQERNSGSRKGFFYSVEKGGYIPAKPKPLTEAELDKRRNTLILLFVVGLVGVLVYIFREKLKKIWLEQTKRVLTLEVK